MIIFAAAILLKRESYSYIVGLWACVYYRQSSFYTAFKDTSAAGYETYNMIQVNIEQKGWLAETVMNRG